MRLKIKSQKKIFMAGIFIIFLLVFFVLGSEVSAADNYGNYGLDNTLKVEQGGTNLQKTLAEGGKSDLATTIGTIVGAVLAFIGVIFLILMIYGGFVWMTAQGNDQQVEKAKNLITAAIIGLIIVFAAYAITAYIGGKLG